MLTVLNSWTDNRHVVLVFDVWNESLSGKHLDGTFCTLQARDIIPLHYGRFIFCWSVLLRSGYKHTSHKITINSVNSNIH